MDKLKRAQKCSILGPQNLGSKGGGGGVGSAPEMCNIYPYIFPMWQIMLSLCLFHNLLVSVRLRCVHRIQDGVR